MDQKISILVGTPAYNSMIHTDYLHSIMDFYHKQIPISVMTLGNESLITRGRNTIISYFYANKVFSHLLFLDADIFLSAEGLIKLLSHKVDVIGAPVALKGFNSETGKAVYNVGTPLSDSNVDLVEVDRVGNAVLMLSRKACDDLVLLAIKQGAIYNRNPHTRGDNQDISHYDVFRTGVTNGVYLSEDFYICKTLREELGHKIFIDQSVATKHNGMFVFQ